MAATVKLFNKGKRVIAGSFEGSKYEIHPEKGMSFHPDEGKKLKRLYPKELLDVNDFQNQFNSIPDRAEAPIQKAALPDLSDKRFNETSAPTAPEADEAKAEEPKTPAPKKAGLGFVKKAKAEAALSEDEQAIMAQLAAEEAAAKKSA